MSGAATFKTPELTEVLRFLEPSGKKADICIESI
jgi:hypothetical protein